jgi:hypothetical protein
VNGERGSLQPCIFLDLDLDQRFSSGEVRIPKSRKDKHTR